MLMFMEQKAQQKGMKNLFRSICIRFSFLIHFDMPIVQHHKSPVNVEMIKASMPITGIRKYMAAMFISDETSEIRNIKLCIPRPLSIPQRVMFVYKSGQRSESFLSNTPREAL